MDCPSLYMTSFIPSLFINYTPNIFPPLSIPLLLIDKTALQVFGYSIYMQHNKALKHIFQYKKDPRFHECTL